MVQFNSSSSSSRFVCRRERRENIWRSWRLIWIDRWEWDWRFLSDKHWSLREMSIHWKWSEQICSLRMNSVCFDRRICPRKRFDLIGGKGIWDFSSELNVKRLNEESWRGVSFNEFGDFIRTSICSRLKRSQRILIQIFFFFFSFPDKSLLINDRDERIKSWRMNLLACRFLHCWKWPTGFVPSTRSEERENVPRWNFPHWPINEPSSWTMNNKDSFPKRKRKWSIGQDMNVLRRGANSFLKDRDSGDDCRPEFQMERNTLFLDWPELMRWTSRSKYSMNWKKREHSVDGTVRQSRRFQMKTISWEVLRPLLNWRNSSSMDRKDHDVE